VLNQKAARSDDRKEMHAGYFAQTVYRLGVSIEVHVMDFLQAGALSYSNLLKKQYRTVIKVKGEEKAIIFFFAPYHFFHLIGLQKLKDISMCTGTPSKHQQANIYRDIISGKRSTIQQIYGSVFFHDISNRVEWFHKIDGMVMRLMEPKKILIKYDKGKSHSRIEADYAFYERYSEMDMSLYFYLAYSDEYKSYVPVTFHPDQNDQKLAG